MNSKSPIGVFDSGLGGLSVLKTLRKMLPHEDFIFLGDSLHNPYGTKTKEEITERCIAICDTLIERDVKAIVIACNTATSASVPILRKKYNIDIIGMEPALKVACEMGAHQKIAVWATDYTLREKKFMNLMNRFKDEHEIYRIPCPKLVRLVEEEKLEDIALVKEVLQGYINQVQPVDSIVLGCTHFVFYKEILQEMLPNVHIVDGNVGTANRLISILSKKGLLNEEHEGCITLLNTLEDRLPLEHKLIGE
ncbi:MAG: glutamate racemase [Bacillota bacterium]|nr:glutamate racemase [Bacillota bacterium]